MCNFHRLKLYYIRPVLVQIMNHNKDMPTTRLELFFGADRFAILFTLPIPWLAVPNSRNALAIGMKTDLNSENSIKGMHPEFNQNPLGESSTLELFSSSHSDDDPFVKRA